MKNSTDHSTRLTHSTHSINPVRSNCSNPRFSVLIPTYNRCRFIDEAIRSVLPQLEALDEIIVMDDGSTDKTAEVMKQYQNEPLIRYIVKEHSNAPDTRNRAIAEAKNPWLLWLDSDDILKPRVVEIYKSIINRFPDVDVIYGNLELFGAVQNINERKLLFPDYYHKKESLLHHLFYKNRIPNPGVLVRKEVYEKYGHYDVRFNRLHDYEFWIRTAPHINVKHCKRIVCKWRWHDGNMSSGSVTRDMKYDSLIVDRLLELYKHRELFTFSGRQDETTALAQSYFEIGRQYRRIFDYSRAIDFLLKSIELKPISLAYYEILSIMTNFHDQLTDDSKGKIPRALIDKAKQIVRRIKGKTTIEKYGIASLNKKLGNLAYARQIFEELEAALKSKKRIMGKKEYNDLLAGSYFHQGEIDRTENKMEAARLNFENCIRIQPNHRKATSYLEELQKTRKN